MFRSGYNVCPIVVESVPNCLIVFEMLVICLLKTPWEHFLYIMEHFWHIFWLSNPFPLGKASISLSLPPFLSHSLHFSLSVSLFSSLSTPLSPPVSFSLSLSPLFPSSHSLNIRQTDKEMIRGAGPGFG